MEHRDDEKDSIACHVQKLTEKVKDLQKVAESVPKLQDELRESNRILGDYRDWRKSDKEQIAKMDAQHKEQVERLQNSNAKLRDRNEFLTYRIEVSTNAHRRKVEAMREGHKYERDRLTVENSRLTLQLEQANSEIGLLKAIQTQGTPKEPMFDRT